MGRMDTLLKNTFLEIHVEHTQEYRHLKFNWAIEMSNPQTELPFKIYQSITPIEGYTS